MKPSATCIIACWIALLVMSVSPVCAQNVITTVAGGVWVFRGDGGPAEIITTVAARPC